MAKLFQLCQCSQWIQFIYTSDGGCLETWSFCWVGLFLVFSHHPKLKLSNESPSNFGNICIENDLSCSQIATLTLFGVQTTFVHLVVSLNSTICFSNINLYMRNLTVSMPSEQKKCVNTIVFCLDRIVRVSVSCTLNYGGNLKIK